MRGFLLASLISVLFILLTFPNFLVAQEAPPPKEVATPIPSEEPAEPPEKSEEVFKKTLKRKIDPTVVKGEPLSRLFGKPIEGLRLYIAKDGALAPAPYQIDKVNADDEFIFDPSLEPEKAAERKERFEDIAEDLPPEKLAEEKKKAFWKEDIKSLDYNDDLSFMSWDSGDRAPKTLWPEGATEGVELELTDPLDGGKAWAYLLYFPKDPPPISSKDYMKYHPETDTVESDFYIFKFLNGNPLLLSTILTKDGKGGILPDTIDRLKMRIEIKPLFFFSFTLDEENISGITIAYKDGPVRVIRRNRFWATLLFLRVTPKADVDVIFWPNGMYAPSIIDQPFDPAVLLREGSCIKGGADLNRNSWGSKLWTRDNKPFVLDGKMSEAEKNLVLEDQSWFIVYREKEKLGIFGSVSFNEDLVKAGMVANLYYLDDMHFNDQPEEEPGAGLLGYELDMMKLPKGKHIFMVRQFVLRDFMPGDEVQFLNLSEHPIEVIGR